MTPSLIDVLLRPGEFFSRLMTETENFNLPLLILLAGGIVSAGYGYLIGEVSGRMMGEAIPGTGEIITIVTIIGGLVGVFIFWILWSAVIYLISMACKGDGSFNRTLQVIAYGYIPQVIGSVITLVVALEYVPKIVVPKISSAMMQDPVAMQQAMAGLMHDPAMVEMTQITTLITIVFLLWSANIWIFGIQHARKLSMRNAAICVGLPVIAWILYMIYTLGVS